MTRITRRALGAGVLLAPMAPMGASWAQAPTGDWKTPSDAEIRAILARRIDEEHRGVGIVVGIVSPEGRRIIAHGSTRRTGGQPVDGRSVYEIGSMTKVFTSLLLAEAVRRGEVKLDDPVAKYLPAEVHVPERGGKQITLVDLATHTSALPRMPTNFAPKDPTNPYADYDAAKMYAFLNGVTLTRDIGSKFEYSNLGVGLLGHALARRAGVDYPTLVRQRVTGPLGMNDTVVALTPALRARLAQGHGPTLEPAANWDLDALAGAGALRSTADDMLTFLAAELGFKASPLKAAMEAQRAPRRDADGPAKIALGWIVRPTDDRDIYWHNGGTGGYLTFMGLDLTRKVGCVVLTNSAVPPGGDDIGFHILAGRPLARMAPLKLRTAITLPPEQLEAFTGVYEVAPNARMIVVRDGGRLLAQLTGQRLNEIYPETPTDFFWKIVDAQVTFKPGPDGKATEAVIHQNGRDTKWTRVTP